MIAVQEPDYHGPPLHIDTFVHSFYVLQVTEMTKHISISTLTDISNLQQLNSIAL
jgi:hypothetical protein